MKKSMNTRSSTRRDFLKKSALGVASAGFVGADLLRNTVHEPPTEVKTEGGITHQPPKPADITISLPIPDLCLVKPGRFHVGKKTSVSFYADKTDATIFFPDLDLINDPNDRLVDIPMGQTKSITIKPQTPGEKYYRYVVFSKTIKKYGEGGSDPVIIVP